MNNFTKISRFMAAMLLPAAMLTACTENNDGPSDDQLDGVTDGTVTSGDGRFVFASSYQSSGGTAYTLLTGESLTEGEISPENNGKSNEGATQWVFYKDWLYGLTYNQGNAGTTKGFYLGSDGQMKELPVDFRLKFRFSSYTTFDNDIITMSTGEGAPEYADANGYIPMTLLVSYIDVESMTMRYNDVNDKAYIMENYVGNGEYVTLSGGEQVGDKLFCGVCPMGLSQYGSAFEDGKWIRKVESDGFDFKDLIPTESGGTGAGAYKAGELTGTQYPDICYVAIYDGDSFTNKKIISTDKISTPCGRFRSQYYQTVWAAENGDIYVFSPSYSKTMTDPHQQTTLKAGVCRIPKGATDFDDYYVDLESQSKDGNRSFMRCFPAGGNRFLMVMYDAPFTAKSYAGTELAIFDADTRKLTYVENLPAGVTSVGKTVVNENGICYVSLNVENEFPAIYAINTADATAVKGTTILGTDITGFGFMKPRKL